MKKIILCLSIFISISTSGFSESQTFFTRASGDSPVLIENGDFSKLAEAASPAVVDLQTETNIFVHDPFFQYFFQSIDPFSGRALRDVVKSSGSAVIISEDGYLITCAHVVDKAKKISVHLADKRTFTAKVVAIYSEIDLAILKIDDVQGARLPYLTLGTAKTLKNGAPVAALGNSFDLGLTFTDGVVSAVKRRLHTHKSDISLAVIQHNAAVNPGNSGGALVDKFGHLVGINNAIYSKGGGSNGVGFAIPIDLIIEYLNKFFKKINGCVFGLYDVLPLSPSDVDALRQASSFAYDGGVIVSSLKKGTAAEIAGLKPKDIIVSVGSTLIETLWDIRRLESVLQPASLKMNVWRDGKNIELTISPKIVTHDDVAKPFALTGNHLLNGVHVVPLTPELALKLKLPVDTKGFIVMNDLIPSNDNGFDVIIGRGALVREGDIVLEVNGKQLSKPEELNNVLSESGKSQGFTLKIWRKGQTIQFSIGMPTFNMTFD